MIIVILKSKSSAKEGSWKKCIVHLPFCQLDCNNCIICFRNFDALLLCWNPRMIRQLPCVTLLWFLNTPLALFFVTQGTTFLSYKEPNSLLFEELFSLSYNELHSLSSKELHSLSCKEKSCSPSHLLFQDPIYSRNYILLIQGIKGLFKDRESDLMLVSDQAVFSSSCLENLENHKVFEIPWERFISCLRWYDTLWFAHRPVTIERNTCGPEKCIIYNILYCRSVTMDRTTCGSKISVISIDLESGFLYGFDNFHQTVPCERKKNQVLSRSKANS